MPITVSCPACSSRFSLSDDLYRRRVAGSLVKVKCRHCQAEIAVDATESEALPSHESAPEHPLPPRRKAVTQMGLGTPAAPAELVTSSPLPLNLARSRLPLNATVTPLPLDATVTPLPLNTATATPVSTDDAESLWSDDETIAINRTKAKVLPRPSVARTAPLTEAEDLELIDAEEVPVSSSGAPTLEALTLEAGGAHVPHGKPPPDEFLVSLSAGGDSMLGAPTIDVTSFAAEISAPSAAEVALESAEEELEYRPARTATIPLFDMSDVLPPANRGAGIGNAAPAPTQPRKATESPVSEGRSRERKFVIAPQAEANATEIPTARRSGAMLWVGLLAAAAVAAVIGSRELNWTQPVSNAPQLAGDPAPAPTPVVNTLSALPAETTQSAETANGTPTASAIVPAAPIIPAQPTAQNITAGTTQRSTPSTAAAVKGSADAAGAETKKPTSAAEPAEQKPVVSAPSVEVHNAPPPAAPDTEFDRSAARNALASAAVQASSCRKEGDPSGTANLTVTFAPSGRVTSAQVQGPPFSGTPTGGCIASTMRRASVPAFSGEHVTVSKTIVVQ
ncbi:MAG TPA: hypothetical protein VJV79_04185 [Polyangiaceae bacterium]|nr:hypothetical protein [Polyangiaceae bacterium]